MILTWHIVLFWQAGVLLCVWSGHFGFLSVANPGLAS